MNRPTSVVSENLHACALRIENRTKTAWYAFKSPLSSSPSVCKNGGGGVNGPTRGELKMEFALTTGWKLFEESLDTGPECAGEVPTNPDAGFAVTLPCDVHVPLIVAGLIPEPLEGLNAAECGWVEDRSWWFVNAFEMSPSFLDADRVLLSMEMIDTCADFFLNGHFLGHHRNAFRPFEMDVLPWLVSGENVLKIRLTAGHDTVDEAELVFIKPFVCTEAAADRGTRGDWRRVGLRKPQYAYGWDWGPRLVTCGIGGPARLISERLLTICSVHAQTLSLTWKARLEPDGQVENVLRHDPALSVISAHLRFDLEIETFLPISTCEADVRVLVLRNGNPVRTLQVRACLHSGWNEVRLETELDDPALWWPNGMGHPDLYTIQAEATATLPAIAKGSRFTTATARHPAFRFGIRTIAVDESLLEEPERRFTLLVNDEPVFCKGGNWIPSDSLYLRIPDGKYRTLVEEAARSGYNTLRVWGGGFYEKSLFYDLCDESGLLVWQDLMFACAAFPDHLPWFREEVAAEIDFQATRLRNHPCLVMWSGNNEIHAAFDGWWEGSDVLLPYGGMQIWNHIAPKILHQRTPGIPYWNSSPYGGLRPGDPASGDVHHWGDCMMNPKMEKRIAPTEFDKVTAKFVSEYGYVGPCRASSIERYHGGMPVVRDGAVWQEHNNTFEKDTVLAGIRKHYRDTDNLSMEEYLLYAGLCQGLMYGYSLEALRANLHCGGAIYWMYNDTWGETGWTTLDYYLTRKVSFPYVRRAFAPVKLIVRKRMDAEGNTFAVIGINETPDDVHATVEYGFCRFDGQSGKLPAREILIPARSRSILFSFETNPSGGISDLVTGLIVVRPISQPVVSPEMVSANPSKSPSTSVPLLLPATESSGDFRGWQLPPATLVIDDWVRNGDHPGFTIQSDTYAHAVHFNLDERVLLTDEYFDLLPGESRRVYIEGGSPFLPPDPPKAASIRVNSLG